MNLSAYNPATTHEHGNPADEPRDLAFQLGQILVEGGQRGSQNEPGDHPPETKEELDHAPESHLSDQLTEHIEKKLMPPTRYILLHPRANLTDAEREELIHGLLKTLGLPAHTDE